MLQSIERIVTHNSINIIQDIIATSSSLLLVPSTVYYIGVLIGGEGVGVIDVHMVYCIQSKLFSTSTVTLLLVHTCKENVRHNVSFVAHFQVLEHFCKERFTELTFTDVNAFLSEYH
jgi:hypothetical protein